VRQIGERLADQRVSKKRARTLISAGVAVAAHLVLIAALVLGIRVARAPNETPALEVTLTRLFAPRPTPKPAPQAADRAVRQPAPQAPSPTPALPVPPPITLPQNPQIDPRLAAAEAVRNALRDVVRCAHADDYAMDPAERAACARRARELAAGAPVYSVNEDDHMRHDPLVASHGMAMKSHLSPRPGNPLGPPPPCEHVWCQNTNIQPGPNIY
jgi:periplasmic protein TonB